MVLYSIASSARNLPIWVRSATKILGRHTRDEVTDAEPGKTGERTSDRTSGSDMMRSSMGAVFPDAVFPGAALAWLDDISVRSFR